MTVWWQVLTHAARCFSVESETLREDQPCYLGQKELACSCCQPAVKSPGAVGGEEFVLSLVLIYSHRSYYIVSAKSLSEMNGWSSAAVCAQSLAGRDSLAPGNTGKPQNLLWTHWELEVSGKQLVASLCWMWIQRIWQISSSLFPWPCLSSEAYHRTCQCFCCSSIKEVGDKISWIQS